MLYSLLRSIVGLEAGRSCRRVPSRSRRAINSASARGSVTPVASTDRASNPGSKELPPRRREFSFSGRIASAWPEARVGRQNERMVTTAVSTETRLRELLAQRILVLDGAWGTMLQRHGLDGRGLPRRAVPRAPAATSRATPISST